MILKLRRRRLVRFLEQAVASPEEVPEALEAAESWSVEARDFAAVR